MSADPLLPVEEAAQRLNVSVETVLRYARRNKWRKLKGNDGVLVAVPPDMLSRPGKSLQEPPPPAPLASTPDATVDAVRAALAPLQAVLEAQAAELQSARTALDAIRGDLADAQAEAAAAQARADTLASEAQNLRAQVEREVADRRTLQGQADALRDQLATAQIERAEAHGIATTERARREAIEARAADLQRQVETLQAKPRRWWPF